MKTAYRGMRVLSSGKIAVLVPPLKATWSLTLKNTYVVRVAYHWAVITNAGTFDPQQPWASEQLEVPMM